MYNKCALFAICASVVSLNHISASQTQTCICNDHQGATAPVLRGLITGL